MRVCTAVSTVAVVLPAPRPKRHAPLRLTRRLIHGTCAGTASADNDAVCELQQAPGDWCSDSTEHDSEGERWELYQRHGEGEGWEHGEWEFDGKGERWECGGEGERWECCGEAEHSPGRQCSGVPG